MLCGFLLGESHEVDIGGRDRITIGGLQTIERVRAEGMPQELNSARQSALHASNLVGRCIP